MVIIIVTQLSANRIDNVDISFDWPIIVRSWKAIKESFKLKSVVAKFYIYAQLIKLRVYNNVCVGVDNKQKENSELCYLLQQYLCRNTTISDA